MFQGFHQDGWQFLIELQHNNNREWFESQKDRFKNQLETPAKAFMDSMIGAMAPEFGALMGKVFRIYRDVRFSKDKTPYNTHLRIAFSTAEEKGHCGLNPAYFFSLEPEKLVLGAGIFEFEKPALTAYRQAMLAATGQDLETAAQQLSNHAIHFHDPELKRVPAGFEADHPRADWLRRKGLSCWWEAPVPEAIFTDQATAFCLAKYRQMKPVSDWLCRLPV